MQRYPEAQDEVTAIFCRTGLKAVGEIGASTIRYASGHFAQETVTPEGSVSASLRQAFHPYLIEITFDFSFRNGVTY
jgi:hypothetical protein